VAELLDVPFYYFSAADLTAAGYKGANVEEIAIGLYTVASSDLEQAQTGVVFIDEVDKIAARWTNDVGGKAVQQALLPHLEGTKILFRSQQKDVLFDTSHVTYVVAGAFDGKVDAHDEESLIEAGMIAEFIGRFSVRANTRPLTKAQVRELLTKPGSSPVWRLANTFQHEGILLQFDERAINALVEKALDSVLGVRAVQKFINDFSISLFANVPQLQQDGITKIMIDAATIRDGKAPWKVPGEKVYEPTDTTPGVTPLAERKLTNVAGWTRQQIMTRYEKVLHEIGYADADKKVQEWWDKIRDNSKPEHILRTAEEIWIRHSSIALFFEAFVYAESENVQAILAFHDFQKLRRQERQEKTGCFRSGEVCPEDKAGMYDFDGYCTGKNDENPGARHIIIRAGQVFPFPKNGRHCWWKKGGRKNG
jgi:hypothetical protein